MSDAQLQYVYKYKYSVKKGSGFENCGRNGLQICTSFPFKPFTCHTTNPLLAILQTLYLPYYKPDLHSVQTS